MKSYLLLALLTVASSFAVADDVTAVVGWSQRVELGTPVSGIVDAVPARIGQRVGKGDELVRLDQRGFKTQVSRRNAEYRHATASLDEARREDERATELYDRTVLSDFERNQALVALKGAQATAEQARAALVDARLDLERSVIRAPFDGVVLAVNAAPGQSIVSELQSAPLVVVADTEKLRATALVDASRAARLTPGTELRASLRGEAIDVAVVFVGFEPVEQSEQGALYELVAELRADPERPVRVGETVTLHLD